MAPSETTTRFLRDNNLDPKARDGDRGAAILLAVSLKRRNVVSDLLELYPKECANAQEQKGKSRGRTPLHNAAEQGLLVIAKSLLAQGAKVDTRTRVKKQTALLLAAKEGHSEMVHVLITNKANVNAQTEGKEPGLNGTTALHLAAELQSPDTILKLLLHGANPELQAGDGSTPLHFAVRNRSASATALLIFHGASPTTRDNQGVCPLDMAKKLPAGDRQKLQHIFTCAKGGTDHKALGAKYLKPSLPLDINGAMHWAVGADKERAVAYLLHIDTHAVEARSPRGWHPLHRSARFGLIACTRLLLAHGAEVDCVTRTGWTPLMLASENGHGEIIQLLLDHGANRAAKNDDGNTAVYVANGAGHQTAVLRLSMRHVSPSAAEAVQPAVSPLPSNGTLAPPQKTTGRRTPSPGPGVRNVEGEYFALSDAKANDTSNSSPQNSESIEKFFANLERTWYDRVQWTPEDDGDDAGHQDWPGPVKVAILDTGIDLNHEDFQNPARRRTKIGQRAAKHLPEKTQRERIKAVKSFVGNSTEDMTDIAGHGTHVAGLILAIAPRAELYIARVSSGMYRPGEEDDTKPASKRGRRDFRRPVEEALRWAIDQNVDIINLSLGFPRESSYELTRTLEEANFKGIITFAAAANHGNLEAIAWPARDRDLAICVTSGDDFNNISRFAPNNNSELPIFITHGEDICSHWPTSLGGGFRKMSGTSVSTPIAVGMAAMILAFLNKTNAWSPDQKRQWLDRSKERRLRSTRGMGQLLEYVCRDRNGVKVLSPHLMWEEDPNVQPVQVLYQLAQAFRLPG